MYRVYTEDKMRKRAETLAASLFDGFTVTRGIGCWRGTFERSQVFDIDTLDKARVLTFARALKTQLKQAAVLVVDIPSGSILV